MQSPPGGSVEGESDRRQDARFPRFAGREIDLGQTAGRARAGLSWMSTRPFGPDGADDTLAIACGAVVSDPAGAAARRPTRSASPTPPGRPLAWRSGRVRSWGVQPEFSLDLRTICFRSEHCCALSVPLSDARRSVRCPLRMGGAEPGAYYEPHCPAEEKDPHHDAFGCAARRAGRLTSGRAVSR